MLQVRLQVDGRLLVIKFGGTKSYIRILTARGGGRRQYPQPSYCSRVNCILISLLYLICLTILYASLYFTIVIFRSQQSEKEIPEECKQKSQKALRDSNQT